MVKKMSSLKGKCSREKEVYLLSGKKIVLGRSTALSGPLKMVVLSRNGEVIPARWHSMNKDPDLRKWKRACLKKKSRK